MPTGENYFIGRWKGFGVVGQIRLVAGTNILSVRLDDEVSRIESSRQAWFYKTQGRRGKR